MSIVLGIHGGHDGAACIVRDGRLVAALASERLTRQKKSGGVPAYVLDAVLETAGVAIDQIDAVAVTDWYTPWAHGTLECFSADERFTDTRGEPLPVGAAIPDSWNRIWDDEVWRMDVRIRGRVLPGFNVGHQKAHCAAAFYTSPFENAWCVSMDASGAERKNNFMVARGDGKRLDWLDTPCCMAGVAYGYFCDHLGIGAQIFKAGAMMALAGHGKVPGWAIDKVEGWAKGAQSTPTSVDYHRWIENLWCEIARGLTFSRAQSDGDAARYIAATMQAVFETAILQQAAQIPDDGCRNTCLGGGSFLNCNANSAVARQERFTNTHLFPACTDDGCAVGGALYVAHAILGDERSGYSNADLAYLGPQRTEGAVDVERVARAIADGKIVAWFQGRSEYGPRALGHRSLLADPRVASNRERLNAEIKHREWYRPFAPSVLVENVSEWFDMPVNTSPFMLFTAPCRRPEEVPAVVHVDGSSRPQTVARPDNPLFYGVIKAFEGLTGVPMVLNTSLNVDGQPILETKDDARQFWENVPVDMMVLGGEVLER